MKSTQGEFEMSGAAEAGKEDQGPMREDGLDLLTRLGIVCICWFSTAV